MNDCDKTTVIRLKEVTKSKFCYLKLQFPS